MYDWERFKDQQYYYVTVERAPCSDKGYDNQCALRLSRSLKYASFPFNSSKKPYNTGPLCSHGFARGAKSLADYLWRVYKRPIIYRKPIDPTTGVQVSKIGAFTAGVFKDILTILDEQKAKGIIFFDNPPHIDGFDYEDKSKTKQNSGIIGEQYVQSSNEVWVYKF